MVGTFLLGARMGQGKFSVNNKRQSIEQSEDLGLSNSRSNNNNKTPATTGLQGHMAAKFEFRKSGIMAQMLGQSLTHSDCL